MKKTARIIIAALILSSCASDQKKDIIITPEYVRHEFDRIKKSVMSNRANVYQLQKYHLGENGFFYIIDKEGTLVFHPQTVLIGKNYKIFPFMKTVLSSGSGCTKYIMGDTELFLIYEKIGKNEVLCLSIPSFEVAGRINSCKSEENLTLEDEKDNN